MSSTTSRPPLPRGRSRLLAELYTISGALIGSSRATCTRISSEYRLSLLRAFLLRGAGRSRFRSRSTPELTRHPLVVTGVRRYRGVRGEITVHHVSPTKDRFRFILRRDPTDRISPRPTRTAPRSAQSWSAHHCSWFSIQEGGAFHPKRFLPASEADGGTSPAFRERRRDTKRRQLGCLRTTPHSDVHPHL